VVDFLTKFADLAKLPTGTGSTILDAYGEFTKRLDKFLGSVSDWADGWGFGIEVVPHPITIDVYRRPLPGFITPTTDNQLVLSVTGGLQRLSFLFMFMRPDLRWDNGYPELYWIDDAISVESGLSFKLELITRISIEYDQLTRKVLLRDVEMWIVPAGASDPIIDFMIIMEEIFAKIMSFVFRLDVLKAWIMEELNARLGEKLDLKLPDSWDVDLVRVRASEGAVSLAFQATITEWNPLPKP
jgi:hypothetical protein